MDWSRAKTILIWAFLFLNLFLYYQVLASRSDEWTDVEAVQGGNWDVGLYLKQQQIELQGEIPQETPEMTYVNVEFNGLNLLALQEMKGVKLSIDQQTATIDATLVPPVALDNQTEAHEVARLLGQRLIHGTQYRYDATLSKRGQIRYWQLHDQYPIFNAPLDIYVENGHVTGYRQSYFHIRSQGSGRQVISAHTALRSLVEREIVQPGEKIEAITLGYFGYHYDADIQVLAPVWRVVHNGKVDYINGFTGAAERPLEMRTQPGS